MTRSGLLLRLSKKDTRDGLDVHDFTPFYRSVPFGVFDSFHLSATIENHPTVAVAAEATQVWKVLHRTGTLTWGRFPFFSPDHNCISVIAHSDLRCKLSVTPN
jgi:hypothetical protein